MLDRCVVVRQKVDQFLIRSDDVFIVFASPLGLGSVLVLRVAPGFNRMVSHFYYGENVFIVVVRMTIYEITLFRM